MVNPAGRRRVKKRKTRGEKKGTRLSILAIAIAAAILLGYLTARFVIGPIIGYNADESPVKVTEQEGNTEDTNKADDDGGESKEAQKTGSVPEKGYALQFGAFSTREAAEELSKALKEKGIDTKIVEADSVFKVITPVIDEKDDAIKALDSVKDKEVMDVFITSFG